MTEISQAFSKMVFEALSGKICIIMRNGRDLFSGVLLKDGDRHFILTASHCINDLEKSEAFSVSTFRNQKYNKKLNCMSVSMLAKKDNSSIDVFDVGIIEISKDCADMLDCDWLTRSDISSDFATPGSSVFALGFPEDLISKREGESKILHPTPFLFISQVADKWPEIGSTTTPFNQAFDFIIHYEKNNIWSKGELLSEIHPHGMSGCGIFSVPFPNDDELWDASATKLAGIQSGIVGKFLRAKRSELAIRLLDEIS